MPATRNSYPHLLPEDARLWNDYRVIYNPPHVSFLYDVQVGEGRDPGPAFANNIRQMATQLSRRRIDVVGILPDSIEIFELTQSCGLRAVGQAMVYPALLKITWDTKVPIFVTVICRDLQSNIQQALDEFKIPVVVVPLIPSA